MRDFINSIDPIYIQIVIFLIIAILLYVTSKKILTRLYPVLQEQNKWYSTKKAVMNTIYGIIF